MQNWSLTPATAGESLFERDAASHELSDVDAETYRRAAAGPVNWDTVAGLGDSAYMLRPTRLNMEGDDGRSVSLVFTEQSASIILEATHRLRDRRERERAATPPVYNFGGDSAWCGGES